LEDYKEKKKKKMERKDKWEKWKKTQALFYRKTSTNYKKWDYFESDEDSQEETEPILPRDDPNFKAMEADMLDRKKRRQRDRKEAEELKFKGNEALKKGLYKSANKYYTDAFELIKDLLPLYTNRALARLKLEDFTGVIDDCTRLLEYNEVFNDGFIKERDLCFKAFMRRSQALRGQKDYELALKDLEEAKKLYP
jgi:tetratricopeptide (TPR) repeat protein